MEGKREILRQGKAAELGNGISGRLNFEKQTLELSDGRTLPVSDANKRDLFPATDTARTFAQKKERIQEKVKQTPGGEFFHQLGQSGGFGALKDWGNRFLLNKEEYGSRKQAESEISGEISERSPFTSGAATVASMVPELALTHGMSAVKAAPLITAATAGSRILDEPLSVAGEAGVAALGGKFIDKIQSSLGSVAARRSASRAIPGQQQAVRNSNIAGQQAVEQANALQSQQFNALKNNVKTINDARLQQYQSDLSARQNNMIQAQNAYEQAKIARESNILNLKNQANAAKVQRNANAAQLESEYQTAKAAAEQENKRLSQEFKLSQDQYQQTLKELPELQRKAQQEYSQNVVRTAEKISGAFPKDSKIYPSQLGTSQFIEEAIKKSELAGSREGAQASKILNSLFPEGEAITGKELSRRYRALEGAIQKSTPEVQKILNDFKNHIGERIPGALADNLAYSRVLPSLKNQVEKEVLSALNGLNFEKGGIASRAYVTNKAKENLKNVFNGITSQDFMNKFSSGQIKEEIMQKAMALADLNVNLSVLKKARVTQNYNPETLKRMGISYPDPTQEAFDQFSARFMPKLDNALAKAELKILGTNADAAHRLGNKVKGTYGMSEPIAPPAAPIAPESVPMPIQPSPLPPVAPVQFPPPINTPQAPPLPNKPGMIPNPSAPAPQSFLPQVEPVLPVAQGMQEKLGDLLEKNLMGGKGVVNNPFAKLGALKYVLGKAALPVEAGYLGLKGLTSPTAAGEAARMTFKQAGVQAIETWAQRYPSYRNGILDNPQERRSLTKEIEDDPEIPLEQKAILQSKVNRGKPLQQSL